PPSFRVLVRIPQQKYAAQRASSRWANHTPEEFGDVLLPQKLRSRNLRRHKQASSSAFFGLPQRRDNRVQRKWRQCSKSRVRVWTKAGDELHRKITAWPHASAAIGRDCVPVQARGGAR